MSFDKNTTFFGYVKSERSFVILVCDIRVPEGDRGHLRHYLQDFAPIIMRTTISYEDIGEFTQGVSDRSGIKVKDRCCVIDSYFGKGIGIIDEYLVWFLEKSLVIDRVYSFMGYNKEPIFRDFANAITALRIKGNKDKHSEMPAIMAKLNGNSAFDSTITNKDKHREVVLQSSNTNDDTQQPLVGRNYRAAVASLLNFVKYQQITPQLFEVERKHGKIVYDPLRYIAKTIFD